MLPKLPHRATFSSPFVPSTPHRTSASDVSYVLYLAQSAAHASLWGNVDAAELWSEVVTQCQSLDVPFEKILASSYSYGMSFGSIPFISRDYRACAVIFASLPNGSFLDGCTIKTQRQVTYATGGGDLFLGIMYPERGGIYTGAFFRGVPHGQGFLNTHRGVTYSGGFLDGQMTGWGRLNLERHEQELQEGIFIDGVYKSNPHDANQQSGRIGLVGNTKKFWSSLVSRGLKLGR